MQAFLEIILSRFVTLRIYIDLRCNFNNKFNVPL